MDADVHDEPVGSGSDLDDRQLMAYFFDRFWQHRDEAAADRVMVPDVVLHGLEDEIRAGRLPPGPDAEKAMLRRITTAFPDMAVDVDHIVAERGMVAIDWRATGTHLGPFNGIPPTGRRASMHAMSFSRIGGGRMVEGWLVIDRMGLARDLGLVSSGPLARRLAAVTSFVVRARGRRRRSGTVTPARDETTGPPPSTAADDLTETTAANRRLVARFLTAWFVDDRTSVAALLAPDVVFHDATSRTVACGRGEVEELVAGSAATFPDPALAIHCLVAEGDVVAARCSLTFTHTAPFRGFPATGRRVSGAATMFLRLADGAIVEAWQLVDEMGMVEELGLMPKRPPPAPVARLMVASIRRRDRRAARRP